MARKDRKKGVVQTARDVTGPVLQVGGDASNISVSNDKSSQETSRRDGEFALDCFLTHLTTEAPIAHVVKRFIESIGGQRVGVFLAESPDSIGIGEDWLNEISQRLQTTDLLIILASPESIERPWVNIETGAAWIQGTPFLSLCHSGLSRESLPQPYQSRQSYDLINSDHLEGFFESLRTSLGEANALPLNYTAMAQELANAIENIAR